MTLIVMEMIPEARKTVLECVFYNTLFAPPVCLHSFPYNPAFLLVFLVFAVSSKYKM